MNPQQESERFPTEDQGRNDHLGDTPDAAVTTNAS
jgi:hypothetical protein